MANASGLLERWAGADAQKAAWPDTWEPTKHLGANLVDHFLQDCKERLLRVIEVDARPLDSLVQRSIAHAVATELSATESFGRVHEISIGALQLGDLAKSYFDAVVERFGLTAMETYDPQSKVTTRELRVRHALGPRASGSTPQCSTALSYS